MNIDKKAYILITNLGKEDCFIHILDVLIPQSKSDKVINLSVDIDNISTPQKFYSSLLDSKVINKINSLVYYPNKFYLGDIHIKVPIRISLNTDSFLWENVVFEQKLEINVKCNQFLFQNNKCKKFTNFQLTIINNHEHIDNKNSIDFSGSSFADDSLFQIIPSTTQKISNINTIFSGCVFGSPNQNSITDFKHLQFNGLANFSNTTFYSSVYFNNSTFKSYADFHESKFDTTACFYGVTFKELPNFSQTIFNGNLNFVNSSLNFDFDECNKVIDNEQKRRESKNNKHYDKYQIANNFIDSFRGLKSVLIKDNNLLDASNCHKIELYFKEIELDSKKPKIFSKEWIDLWQLRFYRLTSNHHTDLLRIFSCIVILIGCFATTLFFAEYYGNPKIWYGIFWATFGVISILTAFDKIGYLGFFTLLSLVPCAWLISYSPKFIFVVASLFGDNGNGIFLNFAFSVYAVLFILLISSLQKTARKNSIIPS